MNSQLLQKLLGLSLLTASLTMLILMEMSL